MFYSLSVAKQIMDVKISPQLKSFVQHSHYFIHFLMVQSILILIIEAICFFFNTQNNFNTIFIVLDISGQSFLHKLGSNQLSLHLLQEIQQFLLCLVIASLQAFKRQTCLSKIDFSVCLVTLQWYFSPYLLFDYSLLAFKNSSFLADFPRTRKFLRLEVSFSLLVPVMLINKRIFFSKRDSTFTTN